MIKKLFLTCAVLLGVTSVSATENMYLRTGDLQGGSWSDNNLLFSGYWDGQQDVYEYTFKASDIISESKKVYFRLFQNNTTYEVNPYNDSDYTFKFGNGAYETYDANPVYTNNSNGDFTGTNGAYCIDCNSIGADTYKISVYVKYNVDNDGYKRSYYIKAEIVSMPVTVTAATYATFCSNRALDFASVEGLTAYSAKVDGNEITFNEVTGNVAKGTGLLLHGNAGTYSVPVVAFEYGKEVSNNDLVGVTEETAIAQKTADGKTNLVLKAYNGGYGFCTFTPTQFNVRANSAYLSANIDEDGEAKAFAIDLNNPTSIASLMTNEKAEDAPLYNVTGQQVGKNYRGIVISNGKKKIVK